MPSAQIQTMIGIVQHYARTLDENCVVRWHGHRKTGEGNGGFPARLPRRWITRRRWCDHEAVQKFRTFGGQQASMAHPHRKWLHCECKLKQMPESGRTAVIATGGALAQAAKRWRGFRRCEESGFAFRARSDGRRWPLAGAGGYARREDGLRLRWMPGPSHARTERLLFWSGVLAKTEKEVLASSQREEIRLQRGIRVCSTQSRLSKGQLASVRKVCLSRRRRYWCLALTTRRLGRSIER